MKSSMENLRRRGFAQQQDIEMAMKLSRDELMGKINSKSPVERTSAIRVLNNKLSISDKKFLSAVLDRLCIEKNLYTKLEICNAKLLVYLMQAYGNIKLESNHENL